MNARPTAGRVSLIPGGALEQAAGAGVGGPAPDQIVQHLLFLQANEGLVIRLLMVEQTFHGLTLLAGGQHAIAHVSEARVGLGELAFRFRAQLFEPVAIGERLCGLDGRAAIGHLVQPTAAGIGERLLALVEVLRDGLAVADGLGKKLERLLFGAMAEGEHGLKSEFESFHGREGIEGLGLEVAG